MTAKRFVDYFDKDHNYIIQDLQNEDEYQVGFVNFEDIKERIKNNPSLKPTLDKMVEDGLSEDDAISVMVDVWAKSQGINVIYRNEG